MRWGRVHSPIKLKYTGLPCQEAPSTRNGRFEPGHVPVQAARWSVFANDDHCEVAGLSFETSRPASSNNSDQSTGLVAGGEGSTSGGMASNATRCPCASSHTSIIPERIGGGSLKFTIPGVKFSR